MSELEPLDFDREVEARVSEYRRLDEKKKRVAWEPPVGSNLKTNSDKRVSDASKLALAVMAGSAVSGIGCGLLAHFVVDGFGVGSIMAGFMFLMALAMFMDAGESDAEVRVPRGMSDALEVMEAAKDRFARLDSPTELMMKVTLAVERAEKQFAIYADEVDEGRKNSALALQAHEEILLLAAQLEVTLEAQTLRHRVAGGAGPLELSFHDEAKLAIEEARWLSGQQAVNELE